MNRHNSYQQPEATADNTNAKQWQVDLAERDTGKVGNDSDAGEANGDNNINNAVSEQKDFSQLSQLVDRGEVDLTDSRVFKEYLQDVYCSRGDEKDKADFIGRLIKEDKIDLSRLEVFRECLETTVSGDNNYSWWHFMMHDAIAHDKKVDMSNEEVVDCYLNSVGSASVFSYVSPEFLGVPMEKIVDNEHIQQLAVRQIKGAARKVYKGEAKSAFEEISTHGAFEGSVLANVLESICSTEKGKQLLISSINESGVSVQELGNAYGAKELDRITSNSSGLTRDNISDDEYANMAKYNDVFKKLGWKPFQEDESLAELFCPDVDGGLVARGVSDDSSVLIQNKVKKIGLIDSDVVDRLYSYQYHKLLDEVKKSVRGWPIFSRYVISPSLDPSGNSLIANYWHEQSKYLGAESMQICMESISNIITSGGYSESTISDLIDDKGILKDAFFDDRPGSLLETVYENEYDEFRTPMICEFLEAHKNQISRQDGNRMMISLLGGMKDENGKYDRESVTEIQYLVESTDDYTELFDANGLKPEIWQNLFSFGDYRMILRYYRNQDEDGKKQMGLTDKQTTLAEGCLNISEGNDWNKPRDLFESYVKEHYDELTIEQIRQISGIVARLADSNASELAERSEAFTRELLKLDTDKIPGVLDKIEDVYIHNHLPYVGKNYLVFRTMHSSPNLEGDFDFSPNSGYGGLDTISPVLQQATGDIRSGKLDQMLNSRDAIIVSDLLRASLGSNNRSIREYLTTLKNGQALLDQLSSGELDWSAFSQPTGLMNRDTKANYDTLSTFAWHLATLYNSTLPGKEHPYQLMHQQSDTEKPSAQSNALQTDFANLTSLIKPNSRYSLADRAVRYFAHFVGIEDLAGAERYMDNVVKEADARNRKTAEYLATTSEPKLKPGDLVKGMGGTVSDGIRYLSYAFQNGSISKEYLGDASRSDTTPLDADMSIVLGNKQTINQVMDRDRDWRMLAEDYGGGLWAVLRSDQATSEDRFIITRRDKREADQSVYDLSVPDANFDRTNLSKEEIDRRLEEIAEAKRHRREGLPKLEAFATGVDGEGHYGIRTGFGMNSIDFFISDKTTRTGRNLWVGWFNRGNGEEYTLVSEVTKLEIALNGFYIPIVDKDSEELIFTPDDYDKMRAQMSGLSHYRTGDYQFAPEDELELSSVNVGKSVVSSTSTIIGELPASVAETDRKHEVINQTIKQAITNIPELNLSYKDYLDGDLTENIVEMIDTGSTGRQTNAPGSGDFDYLARLDRSILNDPTKKQQITDALLIAFGKADEVNSTSNQIDNLDHNEEEEGEGEASQADNKSQIVNGNLRLKQVSIDGLAEPVDIDITFAQKTNKVQYPTDAALADRLSNIKNQSETKYRQVLANIIYAKQFLKAAGAYKPRRSPEAKGIGGLGGVGIENWVLQHGGSFKQAARDFLTVADNCSSFEDFCAHYPVWDYGENHKGIRSKPHDNFVADNMNPEGYELMKEALRAVV